MRRRLLTLAVVGVLCLAAAGVAGATTTDLAVESAIEDDTDTGTVDYTFTVGEEGDGEVDVEITTPASQGSADGTVDLEFLRWEAVGGGASGTGTEWTAQGGEQYRVVYEATARNGADGTYAFDFEAEGGGVHTATFEVTVEELRPALGTVTAEDSEVVFGADDTTETTTVDVEIPNEGDGAMVVDDISFSNEPGGVSATVESISDRIAAGDTGEATVEVSIEESVSAGSVSLTATVQETQGGQESTSIGVDVFKPPVIEPATGTLDVGDVLVGESGTAEIELEEVTGRADIDSLDTLVFETPNGDISVSDLDGMSIPAGGSATAEVSVSIDDDAPQGDTLEWSVEATPNFERAPTATFDVAADVIYPPYFGTVSVDNTYLPFDRPRSDVEEFEHTVSVSVPNDGDLPMTTLDATATIDGPGVDADVTSTPTEIDGRSDGTVLVTVVADPETTEGDRPLTVTLEDDEAGTETVSADVEIDQFPELTVSPQALDFGEVPISTERSRSIEFSEDLEYRDIESLSVTLEEGPDEGWLDVRNRPGSVDAGGSERMDLAVEFDANAELFRTYEWEFRIDGDGIEGRDATVRAVPRPVECTETVNELERYDSSDATRNRFAEHIAETIRTVETGARESRADAIEDVARACAAGRGGLVLLTANEAALEADDPRIQQEHLARIAFGLDTVRQYGSEIQNPDARNAALQGVGLGEEILGQRVDEQEASLEAALEDATFLEEARTRTRLARMAELRGETDAATTTRAEADAAFEQYLDLVSAGNDDLRTARDDHDEMAASILVAVGGVSIFWVADYDEFRDGRAGVLDSYDSAIENFEAAGADERAQEATEERSRMELEYRNTLIFSAIATGLSAVIFLFVVLYEARSVYRYVQDVRAAGSGSFLI